MKSMLRQLVTAMMVILSVAEMKAQVSVRSELQIVPGQVVVKFKSEKNVNTAFAAASLEPLGITVIKPLSPLPIAVCKFSAEKNIGAILNACRALPNVEYAEPNYYVYAIEGKQEAIAERHEVMTARKGAAVIPNDPRFPEQWNLNQANDYDIDAPEAWNITTGSPDIIVGVIDTGIDYDHEDLQANIWHNPGESGGGKENNGIDDDGNGYKDDFRGWNFVFNNNDPRDDNDHGTFNAGVIGAVGNNGKGIAGINWRVKLMALKFLGTDGSGTTEGAAEAIIYAARMGAKVLNNSWGGGGFSRLLEDVIKFANDQGVLFIAAAGSSSNDNDVTPNYPSNYEVPNVIAVAGSDREDKLSSFSNYGRRTVDIVAPNEAILSARPLNRYQNLRGATPHVAGACALVWALYPELKPYQVVIRILGAVDRKAEFIKRIASEGRLNAARALSTSPIIASTTDLSSARTDAGPYPITAAVIDEGTVISVHLIYTLNTASSDTLEMAKGENGIYSASIPGQPGNTVIHYQVLAIDNDSNRTTSPLFRFEREAGSFSGPKFILSNFPTLTNKPAPSFEWETLSEAVAYHVSVLDSLEFEEVLRDTTKSTFYTLPPGFPDGVWHIQIRAVDSSLAVSFWSGAERFTIDTTPPVEPILTNVEYVAPPIRTLHWQASTDVTSGVQEYRVEVSNSPEFDLNFFTFVVTLDRTFTQYTTRPLLNAEWFWRVTAIDRAGNESVSLRGSFMINVGLPPVAPTLQIAKPITNDDTPTIDWTPVDEAAGYRLQYATTETFIAPITVADSISKPGYTFANDQALADGDYYFRVFARNAAGLESVASSPAQLTIDTQAPQAPFMVISGGASFTNSVTIVLNLSANRADSIRLLGDFIDKNLNQFRLFNLESGIGTRETVRLVPGDRVKSLQAQFKDLAGNIANAIGAILLDTQGPVFASSAPQLSPPAPAIQQEVTLTLARPSDGNGSGVKNFKLYYRRGGEEWNEQKSLTFNANNQARLPSEFVTNRGLDFQIVADDSAGNPGILKNGGLGFFSIPVSVRAGEAGRSEVFPGGAETAFFRLVSLPLFVVNKTIAEAFSDLGVYGKKNDYRLWRYDGGRAFIEESQFFIQPGESYFLIKRKSGSLSNQLPGETAKASDAAMGNIPGWQLRANDWTFIGNPFTFEIPLDDLKLKKSDTTLAALANIWKYSGEGENKGWTQNFSRLTPWEGFIVYHDGSTDTLVYNPLSFGSLSKPRTADSSSWFNKSASCRQRLGQGGWVVQVRAESQGVQDNENYFGVRDGAVVKKDRFDLYEPPFLPEGISLSFVQQDTESRRYWAADIRPVDRTGYIWTVQLKGAGGSKVSLQFDGLASLPVELEICLLDQGAGLWRHLRIQPALEIYLPHSTGMKQLNLIAGDKKFIEENSAGLYSIPRAFALHQNYPNPFNPATVIRYELPVPAAVTLRIYNLIGAEIYALEKDAPHEAGYYEKVVDLRDFASGIYFYRLTVQGEQHFERTRKMVLVK